LNHNQGALLTFSATKLTTGGSMVIPITTVLKIKPILGLEEQCLQWLQGNAAIVSEFEGFISKEIYRSVDQEGVLVTEFTFDSKANLDAWENSKTRRERVELGQPYVDSLIEKKQLSGLEFWFESQSRANVKALPAKWKMLIVTIIIIFILINTLIPVVQMGLNLLYFPILVKSFLGVSIMVSLMTYLIMPFVAKYLSAWLVK
jgi:antibiotic biosynthesis monooxygenase (ABM) superfamily enzyme